MNTTEYQYVTNVPAYLFTTSQIYQVELSTELLLCLSILLFNVDQEDTVTPGAVLVHV